MSVSGAAEETGAVPRIFRVLGIVCVAATLAACSTRSEVRHVVRAGETLSGIARRYGVTYPEIASANRLRDPSRIHPGQVLEIPRGSGERQGRARADPQQRARKHSDDPLLQLHWPVAGGSLSSPFGPRASGFHEGVDIRAPEGTPVHAAERGVVVYSGVLRGYGNLVAIRHPDGTATVYAHNQSNWVQAGQRVRRGEVIAVVGRTGRTTGANLHFELWRHGVAVDPVPHLSVPPGALAEVE